MHMLLDRLRPAQEKGRRNKIQEGGDVMSFFITGGQGQLGFELMKHLSKQGLFCFTPSRQMLDITNKGMVKEAFCRYVSLNEPQGVIHCAAYTDVDACEKDPGQAYQVNTWGSRLLAQEAARYQLPFVFISTDYVFNGRRKRPYTVEDTPDPINFYGQSKLAGENEVMKVHPESIIIRTSWLFGINGPNFVRELLRRAVMGLPLRVVEDEVGLPTSARDLAFMILQLLKADVPPGIYHLANRGMVSRYGLAQEVLDGMEWTLEVQSISSCQLGRLARRPPYSVLDLAKTEQYLEIRDFREGLQEYLLDLKRNEAFLMEKKGAMK